MSKKALQNVEQASVSTVAKDEEEKKLAADFLKEIEKYHKKESIVNSLTIPRGEKYLESTLLRFLRARNNKIPKALKMVNEAMAFRKKHDVDNILKKPMPKAAIDHLNRSFYHGYLSGYDSFGRPVLGLRGGACSPHLAKMWNEIPAGYEKWSYADLEDTFIHYHLIMLEYLTTVIMADATKAAGKLINKYVVVDDLSGATARGMMDLCYMIGLFKRTTIIDQLLYPELLGGLFFINSPQIFYKPWGLLSYIIDPETRKKIFLLGGEKSYKPILEKGFPKETLPRVWGGTNDKLEITDIENPKAVVFEKMHEYTVRNERAKDYSNLRTTPLEPVKISARKEEVIRKSIPAESVIEYEISVEGHDIEYSVSFEHRTDDGGKTESVSLEHPTKLESASIRHHGNFALSSQYPNGGDVVIKLSNKHAMMRSKTVYHRVIHYSSSD
eukprot:CAMPEP_0184025558 /NCGR_PEP_ID=MMETSP0954-20121128/12906_1 /TAXON_ID=627963 /ORGANISM="Aplanochytrium sp, Strain PBS07" /LENGTH=441 /DNA_ID=CAMNT_0026309413 /DNA_START=85 /DNA_END=1410 /DNA_ORIENTATION=+